MVQPEEPAVAADTDVLGRVRAGAVRLINDRGVAAVSVPSLCAEAHVETSEFDAHFASVNDVFVEIARFMMAAYGAEIGGTLVRRRSLFTSIRLAQLAFLDVVERHQETQQALMALRVAAVGHPALVVPAGSAVSLHEQFIVNSELWLLEMGRVHDVAWELPTKLLATLVSASLTGIVLDYLARGDLASSRQMIDVLAFDVARRGRRQAKNGSY